MGSPLQAAAGKILGLVPGVTSQDRVAQILAKLQGTQETHLFQGAH